MTALQADSGSELPAGEIKRPSEVIPGKLYVGDGHVTQYKDLLTELGITHVVNATIDVPCRFPKCFSYLRLSLEDDDKTQIVNYFDEAHAHIQDAINKGGAALVHCWAGISRSTTIVLSFILKHCTRGMLRGSLKLKLKRNESKCLNGSANGENEGSEETSEEVHSPEAEIEEEEDEINEAEYLSLKEAWDWMKRCHPNTLPNTSFFRQLIEYEKQLRGSSTFPLEDFHVVVLTEEYSEVCTEQEIRKVYRECGGVLDEADEKLADTYYVNDY